MNPCLGMVWIGYYIVLFFGIPEQVEELFAIAIGVVGDTPPEK